MLSGAPATPYPGKLLRRHHDNFFGRRHEPELLEKPRRLRVQGQKRKRPPTSDGRNHLLYQDLLAEPTGLEPATSDVTGRRSNQLNYDSARNL